MVVRGEPTGARSAGGAAPVIEERYVDGGHLAGVFEQGTPASTFTPPPRLARPPGPGPSIEGRSGPHASSGRLRLDGTSP